MRRWRVLSVPFAMLLAAGGVIAAAGPVFEVTNGPHEVFERVVTAPLTSGQAASLEGSTLVEVDEIGVPGKPVAWALDPSGPEPVLAWVMPGVTPAGATRRFAVAAGAPPPPAAGDLRVQQTDQAILVSNAYFEVSHPRRGGGGFPREIRFRVSGNRDPELHFLDRLFRPGGDADGGGQFLAAGDPEASAAVLFESPVRVVIEARTRYVRGGTPAPGTPRITYRYVYTPLSPVIEVTAEAERDDDAPWREQHFLHLSRKSFRYTAFVGAEPALDHTMQAPGVRSRGFAASQWAVMATETDAAGVGGGPVGCWDASDEFVYYIVRSRGPWTERQARFEGCLYLGPAAADRTWYERWLGPGREPAVKVLGEPGPGLLPAEAAPQGAYEVRNQAMALTFGDAAAGFACTGIRNLLGDGARFVNPRDGSPGFWRLTFRTPVPPLAEGSGGKPFEEAVLDNRSPGDLSASSTQTLAGTVLTFVWGELDLPGEEDVVDVTATVLLRRGNGPSEWRLEVANRSSRFGLWEASFPLLSTVCPPGAGDVLQPRGNWGGTLVRRSRAGLDGRYPSAACPVQFMAFHLGKNGLYLGAHDEGARTKRVVITPEQDAAFVTLAENAGMPGAWLAAPFPVVIAAYEGDWWQAARRYRQWATQQPWTRKGPLRDRADVPGRLEDLGLWWLGGGDPPAAQAMMRRAAEVCPLPIGLHWYNWHVIPFDNSYPEYFPAKEGFAEAVKDLTGRGQLIMPYINGRLWDRDIPSFESGIAGASKQPNGDVYIETYGSGRRLCPMCPTTSLWQDTVFAICQRLMSECGVNAIYLDQIGAAAPAPCFDPDHGHPLGGGRHWVDGYRALLERVKGEAARQGVALTTENTAEPYMDTIDAYLAWNPRYDTDVPLLPAVYSGYTIYFTSPQDPADDLTAFAMAQGRDFLWGCQLGWNGDWLLAPEHQPKLAFELDLCRMRLAAKDFMLFGELLDEIRPRSPVPALTTVWRRSTPHPATLPSIQGTLWRARDGRLAVFLVNYSDRPGAIDYEVQPESWGLSSPEGWLVQRLTPRGIAPWQRVKDPVIRREVALEAREVRALVIAPYSADAGRNARAAAGSTDPVLAACANEFLFFEAVAESGLWVSLPSPLQKVVPGEPLALDVRATALKRGTEPLMITWPDGTSDTLEPGVNTSTLARRLVWAGDGTGPMATLTVGLRLGKASLEHRVRALYQPALELRTGFPAAVRGGESFVVPASVTNNSLIFRRGRVVLDCPPGWQVEPGASADLGLLRPGESRPMLFRVRVPPADRDGQATVSARVVEPAPSAELTVLRSRPVARALRRDVPPVLDGRFDDWSGEPALRLGEGGSGSVRIEKEYTGPGDCSAEVYLGWDPEMLYLAAAVTDNSHAQTETGPGLWQGDCLQLAFRPGPPNPGSGYDGTEAEVGLTLGPGGPEVFRWMPAPGPCPGARLAVVREDSVTRYEAAIPWAALGVRPMQAGRRLAWSMTVNDNDGTGFQGWLEWTPGICGGKDSSAFGWFEAVEP